MLSIYKKKIDGLKAKVSLLDNQIASEEKASEKCVKELNDTLKAQEVIQSIAQTIQQQAHQRVSSVVSRCLTAVFDDPYEFRMVFEQKRGKTEARLVFIRNGVEFDPMTESGGGVVDVASFALRVAALVLSRPQLRRVVILDEPFRFVSRGYRSKINALLQALVDEMQIQFVIVTHFEDLRMGTVIDLS